MPKYVGEILDTHVVFDPHCATPGAHIVARGFKSPERAQAWLDARTEEDEGGFVGCIVIHNRDLPAYGYPPSVRGKTQRA